MRLLTHLIQPTIASTCLHENKWKSQNPNLKHISEDPDVPRTKLRHLWEFWNSDFFLCMAYHYHLVRNRRGFFFQVIITCPWVAGLTCCISESHQSIVYPWPQAIVGSPLTAWLTPIQENIWISEGQLISVRDVRQLLWTTLFLSLHKKGTCNLISRIRGALSLL